MYIYLCVCVCVNTHTHLHTQTHIRIHTFMHIQHSSVYNIAWYDRWLEGEEVAKGKNGKKAEEVKGERCSLYPFILSVSLHIHCYYNFSTLNPRP